MKTCTKCASAKPITEFSLQRGKPRTRCKSCESAAYAEYRVKNLEKLKARRAAWYINNAEHARAYAKCYAEANKAAVKTATAKWRNENKEHLTVYERERVRKDPVAAYAKCRKYAMKKRSAIPSWFSEFDDLVVNEAHKLAAARAKATGIRWHVDHIVPLTSKLVCGLHCASNVAVVPMSDNCRKQNRFWPDMW